MEHLGPTITIDTTGVLPLVREAQEFTRPMGRMVQVAAAPLDQMMEVHVVSHVLFNKQLMGAIEGDSIPQEAVPEMIQWWKDGQFPFDKFVKYYAAAEHEQAILDMKGGEAIKPVLIW